MAITVRIPTPLQRLTNGQGEVQCAGTTVQELLGDLERRYPGIKERICDEQGKLRRFVNVFVNEEDIRFLQGDQTAVKDGDEVSIIPAIAGGALRLLPLALLLAAQTAVAAVPEPAPGAEKKTAAKAAAPPACDEQKVLAGAPVATSEGLAAYYAPSGELALVDTAARRTLFCQPIGIGWDVNGFQSIPSRADASENALAFVVSGEGQYRYFDVRKGAEVYLVSDADKRVSFLSEAPPSAAGKSLPILQQWKGAESGAANQAFHLVATQELWTDIWSNHATRSDPAPAVDFTTQMALAFFAGPDAQAAGISLAGLRDEGGTVVARYTLDAAQTAPAGGDSPFGLFVVPRVTKPVIVQEGISRAPGGPIRWLVRHKFDPLRPLPPAASAPAAPAPAVTPTAPLAPRTPSASGAPGQPAKPKAPQDEAVKGADRPL